jgi:transposase InsO family protein
VSRQGYYEHLENRDKPYKYAALAVEIEKIVEEDIYNDTYGYPRIYDALKLASAKKGKENADFPAIPHERTVYRIMRNKGLIHRSKRKPNGITKEDREARKTDDLFKRDFTSGAPNEKAVTDITEIPCANDKKLYVSGIFDCFDLYPLGLMMETNMKASLCVRTVEEAAKTHDIFGIAIHSDRGSQYTSREYRDALRKYGIVQSMNSAGGRGHDNARCESIWARFKEECLYDRYDTKKMDIEDVKTIVWRYFMSYWTNRRICRAIGGIPPAEKRRRFFANEQPLNAA